MPPTLRQRIVFKSDEGVGFAEAFLPDLGLDFFCLRRTLAQPGDLVGFRLGTNSTSDYLRLRILEEPGQDNQAA